MNAKKVIIAVSLLDGETHKPLLGIKKMDINIDTEIHMVFVMPVSSYIQNLRLVTFPSFLPEERFRIEERFKSALADLKEDILPNHKHIYYRCLFDSNTKAAFANYVKDQNADLVIVVSRRKR